MSGDLARIGGKPSKSKFSRAGNFRATFPTGKKKPTVPQWPRFPAFVTARQTIGGNLAPASASQWPIGFADEDYRKVADEYDKEFLKKYEEDLDTTLIFVSPA